MLRLLLCVVIFICCTSLGIIKASSIRNRRAELENTLELIRLLELDISTGKKPWLKLSNVLPSLRTAGYQKYSTAVLKS